MFKLLLQRLRLLTNRRVDEEVDEELQFHLDQQIEANLASGMSKNEARRQAVLAFGGVEGAREGCREARPGFWIGTIVQDVRYGLRGFRHNPAFAATIVVTLMLGIGATAAVFSVVDRILFRSLPYQDESRLVSVGLMAPVEPEEFMLGGSYYEWRDHQQPFEALTSEIGVNPCDLTEERPKRLSCAGVEANFLPTLGVVPVIGRNFTVEEDRPHAPRVGLISYQMWKSRFGGDRGVLERLVNIDGEPVRVIGVLPKSFEMPRLQFVDVLVPQALDEVAQRKADPGRPMWAYGRLKPGVTVEQAKLQLQPLFEYSLRLAPAPFRKEIHLQVRLLRDRQMQSVRGTAWILLALAIVVLLIACANAASLLMARAVSRQRELAIRAALGASRVRLVGHAMVEALLLWLTGAVAGCIFAELILRLFHSIPMQGLLLLDKAQLDLRIVLVTMVSALFCGTLFGMMPMMRSPGVSALTGRATAAPSHALLRQWLVVIQIAASMVLLTGGALLFSSFMKLQQQNLGLRAESVVTATVSLGSKAYPTVERQMEFFQQLQKELRYGPGINTLAVSDSLPPGGPHHDQIYASIGIEGRTRPASGTGGLVTWRWVTPDYFRALSIPIVRGEGFTEEEQSSQDRFLVLSRRLASRIFPGENPIGHRLRLAGWQPENNPSYMVVGVAEDVKNGGLAGEDQPEYYRLRRDRAEDWSRTSTIIVGSKLPADEVERWLRSRVAAMDTTVPVHVETFSQRVANMAGQQRFEAMLVGFFALTGLLMAVVGLYGVVSYLVAQRTQEIGVRIALGADRWNILRLVMGRSMRMITAGTIAGVIAALMSSRLLSSMLFHVSSRDPMIFGAVAAMLMLVALAASLIPARLATMINPTEALRSE